MTARTIVTVLALCFVQTQAAAASDPQMKIIPAPDSQIDISSAMLVPVSGGMGSECVTFINHAPQAVKHIRFVFSKLDAAGAVFGVDVFDRRGSFVPSGTVEGMRSSRDIFSRSRVANCHDTDLNRRTPDAMRVEITAVDFEDGTTWQGPLIPAPSPAPATPLPSPSPVPVTSPSP